MAIVGSILGDQHNLAARPYLAVPAPLRIVSGVRLTAVPLIKRDGAESAGAAATVSDFEVCTGALHCRPQRSPAYRCRPSHPWAGDTAAWDGLPHAAPALPQQYPSTGEFPRMPSMPGTCRAPQLRSAVSGSQRRSEFAPCACGLPALPAPAAISLFAGPINRMILRSSSARSGASSAW